MAKTAVVIGAFGFAASTASAQDVWISPDKPFVEFDNGQEFIFIERNQDPEARIPDFFTMTSRECPPFCIQPMDAGPGVITVGELEVLEFMEEYVNEGRGAIIDARLPEWYRQGTIPGSINLSFTAFENPETNPFMAPILTMLGGQRANPTDAWDFTNALDIVIFCNGQWCGQSHRAIENLLSVGYPGERIRYYRGGMQGWVTVGLTVQIPNIPTQ
jgi:rhodanese-related sulfurtransferase